MKALSGLLKSVQAMKIKSYQCIFPTSEIQKFPGDIFLRPP
jgi:hypothetical protein